MSKHTQEQLSVTGKGTSRTTLWAHVQGQGAVLVADFSVGHVRRSETKKEDARRAAACWNLCHGLSTEQIEEALRNGLTIDAKGLDRLTNGGPL